MITPIDFRLEDFTGRLAMELKKSLEMEDLHGSALIDNLILLQILEKEDVQEILREKYRCNFTWLNIDPTPPELRELADKYEIFIQREQGVMYVYVPLGAQLDNAALQIDIPDYKIMYVFIADANYREIRYSLPTNELSPEIADFRPLLLLRKIVYECQSQGSTDIHFESYFSSDDKSEKIHTISFKVNREKVKSGFDLDWDLTYKVIQATIAKLSPASAADLDSERGITTSVHDLYGDGNTDLRITCSKVNAGLYANMAVQNVKTTTMTIDQLGFPKDDVEALREIAQRRTGLTLVTGAVRTGKNTTILAMANELQKLPIQMIEYSNPVEVRMSYPQIDYHGSIEVLKDQLRLAKKQDLDIAIINEIPDADVAFAVRDLVNSAIGVITTMHVSRVWHTPDKLNEFYGKDYKTIISQLNAIINQKLFRVWKAQNLQKRILQPTQGDLEKFAYKWGVRQYFVPTDMKKVKYGIQPLAEIIILSDEERTAMLNFDELARAQQMLKSHVEKAHANLEYKLADFINQGRCPLEEMRVLKSE